MKEGKIHKGGQNRTYQIAERPADPPPMLSATWICGMCGREHAADGVTYCPCHAHCPECGAPMCPHVADAMKGHAAEVERLQVALGKEKDEAERMRRHRDDVCRAALRLLSGSALFEPADYSRDADALRAVVRGIEFTKGGEDAP